MNFKNKHIISIKDLSKEELDYILTKASHLKNGRNPQILKNKVLATLFFEPSTRTRLSFEAAITLGGGTYIGFADSINTSVQKGESLKDTVKTVCGYCDAIAIRHPYEGAARAASEVSKVPIINAGDGANQHPTQTLLDLFTMKEQFGNIENLNIGLFGDLKYGRTVHSLSMALANYNVNLYFISPSLLRMPDYNKKYLTDKGISFYEVESLQEIGRDLDVLYVTRLQRERFGDPIEYEKVSGSYRVTLETMKILGKNTKLMHPLPKVDEIAAEVDDLKNAIYFEQAHNGIYVRQALLGLVTGVIQ